MARDYKLAKCILNKDGKGPIDLINIGLVSGMILYEDIFHNTLSGSLMVPTDPLDVINMLPLEGNEVVDLRLDSVNSEETCELSMSLYLVGGLSYSRPDEKSYTLELVSTEYLKNLKTLVSRSYKDEKIDYIIKDILNKDIDVSLEANSKIFEAESTRGLHNIIIPNWKPFDAIDWLANRAVPDRNHEVGFTFFESRNGFHFRSYDSLLGQQRVAEYSYSNPSLVEPTPPSDNNNDSEKFKFMRWQVDRTPNIKENIENGMYSNKIISHDWINMNYEVQDQDSETSVQKVIYENYDSPITEHLSTKSIIMSRLQQLHNFKLIIEVDGDFDRRIGQTIDVVIPISKIGEPSKDELLSGKYLISGIKHVFTDTHASQLELIKGV
tara:strand:+ start:210 stop:1355 length:1146 start_codon:yes stop_codon:yes gene_type:complete